MDAISEEVIDEYYDLLEKTLNEHNLSSSPGQIYNMDESGDPRPLHCVDRKRLDIVCLVRKNR